jgi:hypothetical protein
LLIHHTRKGGADDPLEALSGSNGLSACADTTLVLDKRVGDVTLYVRGRDVMEKEDALESVGGGWSLLGEAKIVHRTDERKLVLEALSKSAEPMTARELSDVTGRSNQSIRQLLARMSMKDEVGRPKRGLYTLPPVTSVTSVTSDDIDPENIGVCDDE